MQMISIAYHDSNTTVIEKSIYFSLETLLMLLVITFSSFRYIRISTNQFLSMSNYYYIGGNDTAEYLTFFNAAKDYTFIEYINEIPMEKMYAIFFWLFCHLNLGFELVLCLNYAVIVLCLIKICKTFNLRAKYFLSLISLMIIIIQSFNTLRWSTSLLLSIWVIDALLKNKTYKAFFMTIFFSVCFHTGSLSLMVPVLGFMLSKNLTKKKASVVYFITVLIGCSLFYSFPFEKYFGNNRLIVHIWSGGENPVSWGIIYIFYLFNVFIVRKNYFQSKVKISLFYICLCLMPLCLLEIKMYMMYRFSHFGHFAMYFGLIELLDVNKKEKFGFILNGIIYLLLLLNILSFYGNSIIHSGVPYIFGTYGRYMN